MAKNLTTFVKSVGASGVKTDGLIPICVWDYSPNAHFVCDRGCTNFYHQTWFCVPAGICCAKFEIWGAGGTQMGSCNCMYPGPSGSGAYAYKTITVNPGECYRTHVGWNWCCVGPSGGSNTVKTTGGAECTSRHSWITGTGLTNFCAEHGCGAASVCCNTANADGTITYVFRDSANEGARYFGADGGARGRTGWIQLMDSGSDVADYLQYRQGVPYPGGIVNACGGHFIVNNSGGNSNTCCMTGGQLHLHEAAGISNNPAIGGHMVAGWGSAGNSHCGGGVCCGNYIRPGRVRISYSCCNTFEDN